MNLFEIKENYRYFDITQFIEGIDRPDMEDIYFFNNETNDYLKYIDNNLIDFTKHKFYIRYSIDKSENEIFNKISKLAKDNLNLVRMCYIDNMLNSECASSIERDSYSLDIEDVLYTAEQFYNYIANINLQLKA